MPAPEPAASRILAAAVASGRWNRPFLLVGRGPARDGAAEGAAAAVLCGERPPGSAAACGACGPCHRVRRDLHPDLHRLLPAKGRVSVGVDSVEELQGRLALRPVEGRGVVALVPSAEGLTEQAQNALLKTLEEPPPRTLLLLTVAAPRALLSTVRSRCALLRFPPPAVAALGALAADLGGGPAGAAALLAAGAGDPDLLREAAADGLPEAAGALARALSPGPPGGDPLAGAEEAVAWVRGRGGSLEEQRRRLRGALRYLLALHHPGGGGAGEGAPGGRPGPYNGLGAATRRRRLVALGEARERVERNVDPAGILEALAVACAGPPGGRGRA